MKRFLSVIAIVSSITLAVAACGTGGYGGGNAGQQFLQASQAAGVPVRAEEVFTVSRGGQTVTAAPVIGWEQIPPTALRNGVEFAYINLTAPLENIPAGSYKLRGTADVTQVGTTDGRVEFIDGNGRVAGTIAAEVEVHSLTVPPEASRINSYVTMARTIGPHGSGGRERIWFRCSNGSCIRFPPFPERVQDF